MGRAGHVARMGESRGVYPRSRWKDNIKMVVQEAGCGGMDWIDVVRDRDRWRASVNAVMNLRAP
jgi:hypothetical protein